MKSLSALLALAVVLVAAEPPKGEPTNAKEAAAQAAAKKAAQDKVVDERYQAWLAKLSPAEQAWEAVLQQQLGGFYLPLHKRDKIAGKSNAWDFVKDDPKLPRSCSSAIPSPVATRSPPARRSRARPTSIVLRPTAGRPLPA
jgi:hypothetical protein